MPIACTFRAKAYLCYEGQRTGVGRYAHKVKATPLPLHTREEKTRSVPDIIIQKLLQLRVSRLAIVVVPASPAYFVRTCTHKAKYTCVVFFSKVLSAATALLAFALQFPLLYLIHLVDSDYRHTVHCLANNVLAVIGLISSVSHLRGIWILLDIYLFPSKAYNNKGHTEIEGLSLHGEEQQSKYRQFEAFSYVPYSAC